MQQVRGCHESYADEVTEPGRPERHEAAEYYFKYIRLVPQGPDIRKVLSSQTREVAVFLERISEEQSKARYAPGKWSVRQVLAHLSDCERLSQKPFVKASGVTSSKP